MKNKQTTLIGEKPFISRNKKIIKSSGLKFYHSPDESFEGIIKELENKIIWNWFIERKYLSKGA